MTMIAASAMIEKKIKKKEQWPAGTVDVLRKENWRGAHVDVDVQNRSLDPTATIARRLVVPAIGPSFDGVYACIVEIVK